MSFAIENTHTRVNLGCGDDYRDEWVNVDVSDSVSPDVVCDIGAEAWPFDDGEVWSIEANHVFEHLDAEGVRHAFREAERVLKPSGSLIITVPTGVNYRVDPGHQTEWTWDTPTFFGTPSKYQNHRNHSGLELVSRRFTRIVGHGPFKPLEYATVAGLWTYGAGNWVSDVPGVSGEIRAVWRKRGVEK